MNKNVINLCYGFEAKTHKAMTCLREKLWYEADINSIKHKLKQCDAVPLSEGQINDIKAYWKRLTGKDVPVFWHKYFYSRNGNFSVRYVPTCIYHSSFIYRLNCRPLTMAYTDKCSYDNYFPDVWRPKTIVRNINGYFFDDCKPISREEALKKCWNLENAVIKPSMIGMWGTGVRLFSTEEGALNEKETVENLFEQFGKDYIIQEKVIQHAEMSRLNPTSLNTLRVLSFRHGDEVTIIYAVVRIGRKDRVVDNETSGGINADIDLSNGRIVDCAYGTPSEKRILCTDIGTELKGFEIPSFNQTLDIVKELHLRLPYFHLIGWDFGIDEQGRPVMIEWNRCPDLSQTAHGPAFGEMTEEIVSFALSQPDTFDSRLWNG
ncbi:MAG: sugar-transfer associated ATP-grasp domain-containing protein [bacterium]|nr:sugar-transfer associated ATP-grasp domain-containing protein [bacterium]